MHEEIGTADAEVVVRARRWLNYDFPPDLAPKLWGGRFAGQTQMWYLLRFTGTDSDIVLDAHDPEFSAVKWVLPGELPNMVIWFKRDSYVSILEEFEEPLAALRL
jgi:putative (di)nucleoside polyphosphate hydrolase